MTRILASSGASSWSSPRRAFLVPLLARLLSNGTIGDALVKDLTRLAEIRWSPSQAIFRSNFMKATV